mmetsp:Transcript_60105/g.95448  ORF Transcript_60105/g.95448 Transcript_60105/m.95448 type:complete len:273 (-) Transcript_60105:244-1062(-)
MCKEANSLDRRTQCIGWLWWNESNTYFAIRATITFVCIATSIYSFVWYAVPFTSTVYDSTACCAQYYVLYFTHYALFAETVYFVMMLYLHGQSLYNSSFDVHGKCTTIIFHVMKACYCVGLPATFLILIVYWPLFYNGNTDVANMALQILQHTVTPLLFFIEFFINLNQLKFKYVAWVLLFSSLYCGMQVVFWLLGGTDENGSPYIYAALDFSGNTQQAAILLAVFFVAAPVMYLALCALDICIMKHLDDAKMESSAVKLVEHNQTCTTAEV